MIAEPGLDAVLHFMQIGKLARSRRHLRRRGTVQPLHPHGVEEATQAPHSKPAFLAPNLQIGFVPIQRSLRGQALDTSDRPGLNLKVRRTREDGLCRSRRAASGGSAEHGDDQKGSRQEAG